MYPVFPYEIFSLIIDQFGTHPDYMQDLLTLGKVSSAFARIRRRHLFREVKFNNKLSSMHYPRLMDLMGEDPTICIFVRHLAIQTFTILAEARPGVSWTGVDFQLLARTPEYNDLLYRFTNVNTLSINISSACPQNYGPAAPLGPMAGQHIASLFVYRGILDHLMAAGHLTTLCLGFINDLPLILILSQPKLLHLELRNCTTTPWHDSPPSLKLQAVAFRLITFRLTGRMNGSLAKGLLYCQRLEGLYVISRPRRMLPRVQGRDMPKYNTPPAAFPNLQTISFSGVVDWLSFDIHEAPEDVAMVAFPNVREITLNVHSQQPLGQASSVGCLFDHIRSLESLRINVAPALPVSFCIDLRAGLSKFKLSLRQVYIEWEIPWSETGFDPSLINALTNGLSDIRKDNVMGAIVINIKFNNLPISCLPATSKFAEAWTAFDKILTGEADDFPNLQYVEICICISVRRLSQLPHTHPSMVRLAIRRRCEQEWGMVEYQHILDDPLKRLRQVNTPGLEICCSVYDILRPNS